MVLNPVSELKRRLSDDTLPLGKRLCLARNVAGTRYFSTLAKEAALAEWLDSVDGEEVAHSVLEWRLEEQSELPAKLVEVIAKYLHENSQENELTEKIIIFLETDRIQRQLPAQAKNFLLICRILLSNLRESKSVSKHVLCQRLFDVIKNVYKAVTKKVDFVTKFLEGETLEVLFEFLNDPDLREPCLKVCEAVLFPSTKKAHFSTFLQTLIRKESIDQLLEEKGDNIKLIMKVMSAFFTFPKGRTSKDAKFLNDFIDTFVSSFKSDNNLIFMFFIMLVNSLNIQQTYLNPTMTMPSIIFEENDDKIKRTIIMKALECLKRNDIDLNVKLTETLGDKLTKVEIKKNFATYLQRTIMGVLKLEGKPDKTSLKIITVALLLDPNLIEPKLDKILPNIMSSKKSPSLKETYTEMLNCLLETLFKLSRGTEFISKILPLVKLQLEAVNTEQFELKQELLEAKEDDHSVHKIKGKIIVGEDLFPKACVDKYGRLTSELMLKQNGELFVSLQREFETHCLILLEEGFVSPSLITLSEALSAILSSVLSYSKLADHSVPLHIAQDFWTNFHLFQADFLSKYGQCLLSLSYNRQLTSSFLHLCLSYTNLWLLNSRYGNYKTDVQSPTYPKSTGVFDFSMVLPCLSQEQWIAVASRVNENGDEDCVEIMNHLLLQKIMVCDVLSSEENQSGIKEYIQKIRSHLIKEINGIWNLLENCPYYAQVLFDHFDQNLEQDLSKAIVKKLESDPETTTSVLSSIIVTNNKSLLTELALETLKNILKVIEDNAFLKTHKSLRKAMKAGFEFEEIVKGSDVPSIFKEISKSTATNEENLAKISQEIEILKMLQIFLLDENCQLLAIFIMLALKNILSNSKSKKLRKNIDELLLEIFERALKYPNLFKIFPINFMFSFNNKFLQLLTLNRIKTTNRWTVVRSVLESAVKKVKTDSDLVKKIVNAILNSKKSKNESSVEFFSNEEFQITCMILPIIAKEKKAITTSQYRSILADLQEKLHEFLLKSFKSVDFGTKTSLFLDQSGDINDSSVEVSESTMATLNAVEAYSLTLSKYCEGNEKENTSNLDSILKCLEYFVGNAILAIQNPQSKLQHIDSSVQLLKIILRNVRTLATHEMFKEQDKLFLNIWQAVTSRLLAIFSERMLKRNEGSLDDIAAVIKSLCELCGVEFFTGHVVMDLANFMVLKAPKAITNSQNTPNSVLKMHQVAKFLWPTILKANIIGPKSAAMSKSMFRTTKSIVLWLRANFDRKRSLDRPEGDELMTDDRLDDDSEQAVMKLKVDDEIYEVLACDLDALTEVIINAKKMNLSHRFLDCIFELHQSALSLLSQESSLSSFLRVMDASIASLNCLPVHRNELLEDRWPCYLQIYRGLVSALCQRVGADLELDRMTEEQLAETAHSFEKLTQAICKQKTQITRLAAYLVADICSALEVTAPSRIVRQHLENCVSLLIQASENTYAMAFLRRALAGNAGQMTMTNLYTMYKRYHKYVGTS